MRLNDAFLGCILLVLAAAVAIVAWGFPAVPGQDYGASTFPLLIAAGIAGCGLVLIRSGLQARGPLVEWQEWTRDSRHVVNVIGILAAIIVWILAWEPIGFMLTTAVLLFAMLRRFRVGWGMSLALAVVTPVVMQYLFGKLLLVPLPWGLLSPLR